MDDRDGTSSRDLYVLLYRLHSGDPIANSDAKKVLVSHGSEERDGGLLTKRLACLIKSVETREKRRNASSILDEEKYCDLSWISSSCPKWGANNDFYLPDEDEIRHVEKIFGEKRFSFAKEEDGAIKATFVGNREIESALPICWGKLLSDYYYHRYEGVSAQFVPPAIYPQPIRVVEPKLDDPSYRGKGMPAETLEETQKKKTTFPSAPKPLQKFGTDAIRAIDDLPDAIGEVKDEMKRMLDRRNDVIDVHDDSMQFMWEILMEDFDATVEDMADLNDNLSGFYLSASRWNSWKEVFGTEGAVSMDLMMGYLDRANEAVERITKKKFGDDPKDNPILPEENSDIEILALNYVESLSEYVTDDAVMLHFGREYLQEEKMGNDKGKEYLETLRNLDYEKATATYGDAIQRLCDYSVAKNAMTKQESVWITDMFKIIVRDIDDVRWEEIVIIQQQFVGADDRRRHQSSSTNHNNGGRRRNREEEEELLRRALGANFKKGWSEVRGSVVYKIYAVILAGVIIVLSLFAISLIPGNSRAGISDPGHPDVTDVQRNNVTLTGIHNDMSAVQNEGVFTVFRLHEETGTQYPDIPEYRSVLAERDSALHRQLSEASVSFNNRVRDLENERSRAESIMFDIDSFLEEEEDLRGKEEDLEDERAQLTDSPRFRSNENARRAVVDQIGLLDNSFSTLFNMWDRKMIQIYKPGSNSFQGHSSTDSVGDKDSSLTQQQESVAAMNQIGMKPQLFFLEPWTNTQQILALSHKEGLSSEQVETRMVEETSGTLDNDPNVNDNWREVPDALDMVKLIGNQVASVYNLPKFMDALDSTPEAITKFLFDKADLFGDGFYNRSAGMVDDFERMIRSSRQLVDTTNKLATVDQLMKGTISSDAHQTSIFERLTSFTNALDTTFYQGAIDNHWKNAMAVVNSYRWTGGRTASRILETFNGFFALEWLWGLCQNFVEAAEFPDVGLSQALSNFLGSAYMWVPALWAVEVVGRLITRGAINQSSLKMRNDKWAESAHFRIKMLEQIKPAERTRAQSLDLMLLQPGLRANYIAAGHILTMTRSATGQLFRRANVMARDVCIFAGASAMIFDTLNIARILVGQTPVFLGTVTAGALFTESVWGSVITTAGGGLLGSLFVSLAKGFLKSASAKSGDLLADIYTKIRAKNHEVLGDTIKFTIEDILDVTNWERGVEEEAEKMSVRPLMGIVARSLKEFLLLQALVIFVSPFLLTRLRPGPQFVSEQFRLGVENDRSLGQINLDIRNIRREALINDIVGAQKVNGDIVAKEMDDILKEYVSETRDYSEFIGKWTETLNRLKERVGATATRPLTIAQEQTVEIISAIQDGVVGFLVAKRE